MGAYRIELSGFNDTIRDRLRARPLWEIISWKLRMFVPTDASGIEVPVQGARHLSGYGRQ